MHHILSFQKSQYCKHTSNSLFYKTNFIKTSRVAFHCVKSVQIRSYFWSVFSFIRTEYRKIWTRKNSVFGHFHAVHVISLTLKKCLWYCRHVLRHWIHQTLSVGTQSVINSEGCYIVSLFMHFLFVLENNCRKNTLIYCQIWNWQKKCEL